MIYLIGGVPGMRKSSIISKAICDYYRGLFYISTDTIRAAVKNLLFKQVAVEGGTTVVIEAKFQDSISKEKKEIKFKIEDRNGHDEVVWEATIGLIKEFGGGDMLVEGVVITPSRVKKLQDDLSVDLRAAFVGYSQNFICKNPELTYNCLGSSDEDRDRSSREFKEPAQEIKLPNYKYFDLIGCVPSERRDKKYSYEGREYVLVEKEDFFRNAEIIKKYLLDC